MLFGQIDFHHIALNVADVGADEALAAAVDGVLLIVRAGKTRRPAAQGVKEQLERVGANILGVVLTDAPVERGAYKY